MEKILSIFNQWNGKNQFKFVFPPESVLDETGLYTKGIYGRESRDFLGEIRSKGDSFHMNKEYGREIVLSLLNKLK